jgi:iron complex transport system substrate-binding protein
VASTLLVSPIVDDATRRRFLGMMAAAGLLTACSAAPEAAPSDAGFPRTVTTPDDGPVVLDRAPRRIVAMNGNRVLPFLAPFLTAEFQVVGYGGDATAEDFPWIAEQLAAGSAFAVADGVPVETVAALAPDLILANGNLGDYWEPARAIAPLVQLPETDLRATVTLLGEVFGAPGTAQRVLAEVDAQVAAARRDTPVTAAVLLSYQDDGTVNFRVPGAELPNFLADLNVQVADSPTAVDGYEDVSLELASERLDVDWVVIGHAGDDLQADLLADPVFSAIPVIAGGRYVVLDAQQNAAGFPVTPPTVPILLDALAPILES